MGKLIPSEIIEEGFPRSVENIQRRGWVYYVLQNGKSFYIEEYGDDSGGAVPGCENIATLEEAVKIARELGHGEFPGINLENA